MGRDPVPDLRSIFGNYLRELREAKGWEQGDVAAAIRSRGLPCSDSSVSDWERGKVLPRSRKVLFALDDAVDAHGSLVLLTTGGPAFGGATVGDGRGQEVDVGELLVRRARGATDFTDFERAALVDFDGIGPPEATGVALSYLIGEVGRLADRVRLLEQRLGESKEPDIVDRLAEEVAILRERLAAGEEAPEAPSAPAPRRRGER